MSNLFTQDGNQIKSELMAEIARAKPLLADVVNTAGGLRLKFVGESMPRQNAFAKLSSYSPQDGDRVALFRISGTYIVFGKVEVV